MKSLEKEMGGSLRKKKRVLASDVEALEALKEMSLSEMRERMNEGLSMGYIRLGLMGNSSLFLGSTNDDIWAPSTRRIETRPQAKVREMPRSIRCTQTHKNS